MQERYKKNCGSFMTEDHQNVLLSKIFAVIGVGGNGSYIAEFLARQGCKKLIIVDFDSFEESNLNRQAFCFEDNLQLNKAEQAVQYLRKINSSIEYEWYTFPYGTQDIPSMQECDMIFTAADGNQYTHKYRESLRELVKTGIPVVEQCLWDRGVEVCIIYEPPLLDMYDENTERWEHIAHDSCDISQPAWLCSLAASLAVAEAWRYFTNYNPLIGQRLIYDVDENQLHRLVNGRFIY